MTIVTELRRHWLARHAMPLMAIALLASVALVYWPGSGGGFVFDDYPNIVDNVALHVTGLSRNEWLAAIFSSPTSSLQRPLAMLTFAVNHYFTGLDPEPMKLTNIAIHMLNTLLVFGLCRAILSTLAAPRTDQRSAALATDLASLLIAGFWGLHPINLMAVLFIVQRMESLSHTFVFIGLWMYVAGRVRQATGRSGWLLILGGLIPCTVLGLLAKESAALLPLYAFCLEFCLFRFRSDDGRVDRRLHALFVLVLWLPAFLGMLWLLPKTISANAYLSRDFSLVERLLTEPRVVLTYLRWILLPDIDQLSLYHDDYAPSRGLWSPPSTLFALLAVFAFMVTAFRYRQRRPLLSLGLLWFFGAQLLTATIIPLELVFEHRNYFASLGIGIALADVFQLVPTTTGRRRLGYVVFFALLLFCTAVTHLRALEWNNQVRFSMSEADRHPQSPRATYDAARTMVILSNYRVDSPFIADAVAALERAQKVPGGGILPDQAALMFGARTGRGLQRAWWDDIDHKLATRPIGTQELAALASLTKCAVNKHCNFPHDDMLAMYGAALSRGQNAEVLNIYGDYALNVLDDSALTLKLWQEASAMDPGAAEYHISLAKLLTRLGRYDEARIEISRLRKCGKLDQYEMTAVSLEQTLKSMPH